MIYKFLKNGMIFRLCIVYYKFYSLNYIIGHDFTEDNHDIICTLNYYVELNISSSSKISLKLKHHILRNYGSK